jgi:hypothetical protein
LPELFTQEYFNFISSVAATAIRLQNLNQIAAVQTLISLNTSLFYTILRCQDPKILEASGDQIVQTASLFTNLFKSFIEIKFNTDNDGSLKKFLSGMLTVFSKIDFILSILKTQIEDLTAGDTFK